MPTVVQTREAVQARMNVQPVEELLEQRAHLIKQNSKRQALYGASSTWKTRRDMLSAMIALEVRRELATEGEKVTDKIVEAHVLTDQRFKAFIDATEDEIAAFHIAQDAIEAINDLLLRDAAIARHTAMEARL